MNRIDAIRPELVERIPKVLDNGVIYISLKFRTAAHNCFCGCGTKIVTPLKPGRWRLETEDGAVSLTPSIGNWSAGCQSHYWIRDNRIEWAPAFTPKQIAANRASDQRARQQAHTERYRRERGFWGRLWDAIKGLWQAFMNWF
ncbi:DUF6527 family protein [Bradyrhizobium valentinum]|uniref:Uncharacterized protein n=1 Tax=Bradyrhizobium valentinum TaxID=1518501 RepID=A0A0R3M0H9_9BRAD|nr:DUF6527 family protein [Bradyrhizobium valentinum]KRR11413.1 hypothetical protein CP49_34535 [Bradyrhizobium valentinum]